LDYITQVRNTAEFDEEDPFGVNRINVNDIPTGNKQAPHNPVLNEDGVLHFVVLFETKTITKIK